jgi:hypothetical protein
MRGLFSKYKRERKVVNAYKSALIPSGDMNDDALMVIGDLKAFCCIDITDHGSDPTTLARVAGRKEVYARIMNALNYSGKEMEALNREIKREQEKLDNE